MTIHKTAALQVLLERFPVGFAQEILDKVQANAERETQFLDIKELNDLAAEYRIRLRRLTADCRRAQAGQGETMVRRVYASHESLFISRQIADLWRLYRLIMADSFELTADYMMKLKAKSYQVSSFSVAEEYRTAA